MAKIIVTDKMASNGIDYLKSKGFEVDTPLAFPAKSSLKLLINMML